MGAFQVHRFFTNCRSAYITQTFSLTPDTNPNLIQALHVSVLLPLSRGPDFYGTGDRLKKLKNTLMELKKDSSIITKPDNKGGATVILNAADNEKAILRQLSDDAFLQKTPKMTLLINLSL